VVDEGTGSACRLAVEEEPGDAASYADCEVRIDFLYWQGCPSHPEARALLEEVLAGRGVNATVEVTEVRSDEEAEQLRFPGSPTIRVDGRDVDPDGAMAPPALTCRIYHRPDGRVSPIPSREQLEAALA
jgi:hypothetical protein